MNKKVYVETTVVSYLCSRSATDALRNGQIEFTRDWWREASKAFNLFTSVLVLDEASAGDPQAAAERLASLAHLPVLDISPDAENLAAALLLRMALPAKADRDALHVAIAATNGLDFLLTWNCRHLANATLRKN